MGSVEGFEMATLFVTTALEEMSDSAKAAFPASGKVFAFADVAKGLPDALVAL